MPKLFTDSAAAREAEILKIARSATDRAAVLKHLDEIVDGEAFRGSHRGGQFLRYVVEQAIAGQFGSLKGRTIAVELFGRGPSSDSDDEAIVRVTASDVRKRLHRHYAKTGSTCGFRIALPLGSYLPEIIRSDEQDSPASLRTTAHAAVAEDRDAPNEAKPAALNLSRLRWRFAAYGALAASTLLIAIYLLTRQTAVPSRQLQVQLPWSAFLASPHNLHLITSDPNIAEIRGFVGTPISTADYANHVYIPKQKNLSPELLNVCRIVLRGDKCPNIDAAIAAGFAEYLGAYRKHLDVRAARDIQLSDLRTDDDFIMLGSPRTNPWTTLFNEQLDFRLTYDKPTHSEYIENVHRRANEPASFVSTAPGWAAGQSFALIALVQNPDQNGQVLLISGANGEGTQAAGKFVRDSERFTAALRQCGISDLASSRHFEMVLRLNMMAGTPNHVELVACHLLQSPVPTR